MYRTSAAHAIDSQLGLATAGKEQPKWNTTHYILTWKAKWGIHTPILFTVHVYMSIGSEYMYTCNTIDLVT